MRRHKLLMAYTDLRARLLAAHHHYSYSWAEQVAIQMRHTLTSLEQGMLIDMDRVDRDVERVLRVLGLPPSFIPGRNLDFWLAPAGQLLASVLYLAHQDELITPRQAGKMIWQGKERAENWLRPQVVNGRLRAIPKPAWAEDASTKSQRKRRASTPRIGWYVLQKDINLYIALRTDATRREALTA